MLGLSRADHYEKYTVVIEHPYRVNARIPGTVAAELNELDSSASFSFAVLAFALARESGHRPHEMSCTTTDDRMRATMTMRLASDLVAMDVLDSFRAGACGHLLVSVRPVTS